MVSAIKSVAISLSAPAKHRPLGALQRASGSWNRFVQRSPVLRTTDLSVVVPPWELRNVRREDGRLLILPSAGAEEAGALSGRPSGIPGGNKWP